MKKFLIRKIFFRSIIFSVKCFLVKLYLKDATQRKELWLLKWLKIIYLWAGTIIFQIEWVTWLSWVHGYIAANTHPLFWWGVPLNEHQMYKIRCTRQFVNLMYTKCAFMVVDFSMWIRCTFFVTSENVHYPHGW